MRSPGPFEGCGRTCERRRLRDERRWKGRENMGEKQQRRSHETWKHKVILATKGSANAGEARRKAVP